MESNCHFQKNAEKTPSQLKDSVSSVEQEQKERRRGKSSGFLTRSWNVYVAQRRRER